jgi:hypothetical protein
MPPHETARRRLGIAPAVSGMTRIISLASALLLLALSTPARGQGNFDSLTCFKPKDSQPRSKFTIVNGSQACTFRTPAQLACVASSDNSITPTPPEGTVGNLQANVLCYRAKCVSAESGTRPLFRDAIAQRPVRIKGSRLVCLPANMPAGTTSTTIVGGTTTTSSTVVSRQCGFEDRECGGTCPDGKHCGAAVGDGSCECRDTSCGDADAPTCAGFCDDPGKACVFDLTGCDCVDIPG